jgi:hypothetical protein
VLVLDLVHLLLDLLFFGTQSLNIAIVVVKLLSMVIVHLFDKEVVELREAGQLLAGLRGFVYFVVTVLREEVLARLQLFFLLKRVQYLVQRCWGESALLSLLSTFA